MANELEGTETPGDVLRKENISAEARKTVAEAEFYEAMTKRMNALAPKKSSRWTLAIAISTGLLTIAGSSLALYIRAGDFLKARKDAVTVTYTTQMIQFSDRLQQGDDDLAVLYLSSYEEIALPFLLFNLEHSKPAKKEVYLRSLRMIKNKPTVDDAEFMKTLITSCKEYVSSKHGKEYEDEQLKTKTYALRNYIYVIKELAPGHNAIVQPHLNWMKAQIENDDLPEQSMRYVLSEFDR